MKFTNTYAQLGDAFFKRVLPLPVAQPKLLIWNDKLAESLGLGAALLSDSDLKAHIFSGNQLPEGAESIALAYSGHQFGQLNPQLGDGRAHLLGELMDSSNHRVDIQLKGSGPTPFSRQGDGRCALGPALREFIMSEAMYYLGVPTSRCLSVVATGETVYRERGRPGAVVTRVAASHIRVGTFQYFAIRKDTESLRALLAYTVERHFPEISSDGEDLELDFLDAVMEKQITLIVEWMRVGFIHGVMNTDNSAISGETIDFGPCAMMGAYDPGTVYSSIDTQGRYAFGNQPNIALWNITRLAECLLPLINSEQDAAIASLEPLLKTFTDRFQNSYFKMLGSKLGMTDFALSDQDFILELMEVMQAKKLDYTQTFSMLTQSLDDDVAAEKSQKNLGDWYIAWRGRLEQSADTIECSRLLMKEKNPLVIPRNHHVEAVLKACEDSGTAVAADDFLSVLRSPYFEIPTTVNYQDFPVDGDKGYHTFCGT
ncbi:hypothetical protein UPF0061 [Psychromonas ingrahamii 37]|uniref:Protein nucleotidyltransferase YdiU n=1 Tax=Psychromonas ingrahamii (strain DSM 17664 / CCUG 51855 / 37) TaxID=357804 RepID=A1SV54_PSYIN|nr:YdiU family protein [Psychromonas ingrahamii]ABM03369.1 hypothetical protein UPF0061 [Psychromonas ingrahamii 37]